ncbi:hypothetical protein C2G38_689349 [Gigaspora rosea]|uniref:Uncharacterized protein n=2 Tax=Gigaspora rosea TaxID=44941 RepID=A0A397VZ92_9GLOM|nr:hypothetical protein C2G38_689349 [Gigaspora rosea]
MVHHIFKNMVPHTNRKNIEFDLLKRYTTLQSIRHLADGGFDSRYSRPSIDFIIMFQDSKYLFKDWFITKDLLDIDNKESEICSQSNNIQNIKLRKPIPSYKQMIKTDTALFYSDLALAYQNFRYNASLVNKSYNFYEYTSYIQNNGYSEVKCHLHKNNVVAIHTNDYSEGYAMIKAIFKHKSSNGSYYLFIYVDWFEDISRKHIKVNCPIFVLRQDTSRCKIFPLTIMDGVRKTHFVHDCNTGCQDNNHDLEHNQYLNNIFFFKAI